MPEPSAVWLVDISKSIESAVGALARANLDAKRHNGRVQLVLVTVTAGMSGSVSPAHGMAGKVSFARQLQAQTIQAEEECYPTPGRKHSGAEPVSPSARPAITMHTEAADGWERGLCVAAVKFKAQRLYISDTHPPKKASRRLFRKHDPSPIMDFPLDLLPSSCTLLIPKADKTITLQGLLNASAPSIETLLLINGSGAPSALHSFNGSRGPSPSRKGLPPLSPRGFAPRLFSPRTASPSDADSHRPVPHRLDSHEGYHRDGYQRPGLPPSPPAVCSPSTAAAVAYSAALASGSPTPTAPLGASSLSPSAAAAAAGDPRVHPPSPRIHFRPFNVSASFASRSIKRRIPSASMRAAFVRRMLSPSARRGRAGTDGMDGDDSSSSSTHHFFNRARGLSLRASLSSHSAAGATAGAGAGDEGPPRLQRQKSFSNLESLMAAGTCSGTFAVGSGAPLLGTGAYGDDASTGAGASAGGGVGAFSAASLAEAAQRAARAGAMGGGRGRSMIPQSEPLCLSMSAAVLMDDSDDEEEEEERGSQRDGREESGSEREGSERGGRERAGRLALPFGLRARPSTPPKSPAARSLASCSVGSTTSIPELENEEADDEGEEEGGGAQVRPATGGCMSAEGRVRGGSMGGRGVVGPSGCGAMVPPPPSSPPSAQPTSDHSSKGFPTSSSPATVLPALPTSPASPAPSKTPSTSHLSKVLTIPNPLPAASSLQVPKSPSSPGPAQAPTAPRLPKAFSNPSPPKAPFSPGVAKSSSSTSLPQLPSSPLPSLGAMQMPSTPRPALPPLCSTALGSPPDPASQPEVESPCSISSRGSSISNRNRASFDVAVSESFRGEEQEEGITFVTGEYSTKFSSSSSLSAWSPARSESSSSARLFRTSECRASSECRTFSRAEVLQATDHFSPKTILGRSVLGTLHKGTLFGSTVAVKRLEHASACEEEEFQREVSILSKVRHPHVALMMGQCPEERCIVYEHLPGGSLHERLSKNPAKPWAPLTWHDRIRISCELAAALVFLHCHDPPIVHGDLRPENILLDRNRRSKVGDVGIAQFVGQGEVLPETWRLSGSVRYIDPSEMQTGEVTGRSDVYALGLIMLQLLLGQPNIRALHKHLMPFKRAGGTVEAAVEELMCCLDPAAGIWPRKVAERALGMALLCVMQDAEARPDFVGSVFPELKHVGQWAEAEKRRRCPGQDEKLMCPLSKTRMQDPVIAPDGYTYERRFIEDWLKENTVSPKTGKQLPHKALVPNLTVLAFVNS